MTSALELKLEDRKQIGHANTKLAPEGKVPAIVYGEKIDPTPVEASSHEVELLFAQHGENLVLDLVISGAEPTKALIREVQRHPLTGKVLHVDFMLASETKTVVSEVNLVLNGNPIGVREEGGILNIALHSVEIEALIKDIPSQIEHDITDLGLNDVLVAGDLELPPNVKLAADPTMPVCSIVAPAAEEEPTEAEEGLEGEGAEPEVIGAESADEEGSSEE